MAEKHRKLKCPKCDYVGSAKEKTCRKCGHGLARARKAKFAKLYEETLDEAVEAAAEQLREIGENSSRWNWRTMGNRSRGIKRNNTWTVQTAHRRPGGGWRYSYRPHPTKGKKSTGGSRSSGGIKVKSHTRKGVPVKQHTRFGGPSKYRGSEENRQTTIRRIKSKYGSIRSFQKRAGIVVDGKVGRQTARAFRAARTRKRGR